MSTPIVQESATPEINFYTTSEVVINAAGPGPFYVYSPGFTLTGLRHMVYLFDSIPGGLLFQVKSGEVWASKEHLPEAAAKKERTVRNIFGATMDIHRSREQPAEDMLNAILSEKSCIDLGLVPVSSLAKVEAYQDTFNLLIHPEIVPDRKYPIDPIWRKIVEQDGMIKLRQIWLESAIEGLQTGRFLEDVKKVVEDHPYLLDIWKEAITDVLYPALQTVSVVANTRLADFEERIRAQEIKVYDPLSMNMMWLLGRKPERTALSRTMENVSHLGQGNGVDSEAIRSIVEAVVLAQNQVNQTNTSSAYQSMQCSDCGEELKMVNGGPPRKCRFCGFEFYVAGAAPAPSVPIDEEDEVAKLARQIQEQVK